MNNDNNSNNLAENPALFTTAATNNVRDANESNDNMLAAVDSTVDKEVAAIRGGGGYLEL